ncbi:hypothetical protein D0Z07_5912 [Hyphodiscus hymeniophilus]|uniref:Uncharacterized protein n=1 Tax=Hyphodiscus hymeniophilus TaxID=353542 RepID=A0A9P7AW48_9HELO|nr:hypothetical protein D0Z07_5912 [Hyphodiscus hymeniophilus]
MDTIVVLEEAGTLLAPDLVSLVRKERLVAIKGSPDARVSSKPAQGKWAKGSPKSSCANCTTESIAFIGGEDTSDDADPESEIVPAVTDHVFANIGGEYLVDWEGPDDDFADFLDPQMNDKTVPWLSSESQSLFCHSTPSTDHAFQLQQNISSYIVSIPISPNSSIRSLIHRPRMGPGGAKNRQSHPPHPEIIL